MPVPMRASWRSFQHGGLDLTGGVPPLSASNVTALWAKLPRGERHACFYVSKLLNLHGDFARFRRGAVDECIERTQVAPAPECTELRDRMGTGCCICLVSSRKN